MSSTSPLSFYYNTSTQPPPSTTTEDWQETEPDNGTTPDDEEGESTTEGDFVTEEPTTTTTTTRRPSPICDPDRYYYIPFDGDTTCTYYVHCNYGIPVLLTCAEGTLFNPAVEKCVRSEHYTCPYTTTVAPTTTTPATTEAPVTTEDPATTEAPSTTAEATTNRPTTPEPPQPTTQRFVCPLDPFIYLPHQRFCRLFYLCTNGQYRGEFSCGDEHWFDSATQGCVRPENSDCTLEPLP